MTLLVALLLSAPGVAAAQQVTAGVISVTALAERAAEPASTEPSRVVSGVTPWAPAAADSRGRVAPASSLVLVRVERLDLPPPGR